MIRLCTAWPTGVIYQKGIFIQAIFPQKGIFIFPVFSQKGIFIIPIFAQKGIFLPSQGHPYRTRLFTRLTKSAPKMSDIPAQKSQAFGSYSAIRMENR